MKLIVQGKTNIKYLFILTLVAIVVGGVMAGISKLMKCPYFWPSWPQISDNALFKNLDEEFSLGFGQTAVIEREDLKIRFLDVLSDSRCPSDAQCIWAGEAIVSLSIQKDNQKNLSTYEFTSQVGSSDIQNIEGYFLKLVSVNPYPVSTKTIEKSDYTLTLFVSIE
ncbi:MAG: hypothetical protein ABIG40_03315 [Parcubacteria group bacterium]